MSRQATIIGSATDVFGHRWDVREQRQTRHGWPVLIGWPANVARGPGSGGPRVIPTQELVDYLESTRLSPKDADLPIGRSTLKRLRALLGYNWYVDNCCWWTDHPEGPGKSAAAVSTQRKLRGFRARVWSREEDNLTMRMLDEGRTLDDIAARLGRSKQAVLCHLSRLRKKHEGRKG